MRERHLIVFSVAAAVACGLLLLPGSGGSANRRSATCPSVAPGASADSVGDVLVGIRRVIPQMRLGIDTRNFQVEYVAMLRNDFGVAARLRKRVAARCGARFASFTWSAGVFFPRAPAVSVGQLQFVLVDSRTGWRPVPLT